MTTQHEQNKMKGIQGGGGERMLEDGRKRKNVSDEERNIVEDRDGEE